jgi:hypothetical protein
MLLVLAVLAELAAVLVVLVAAPHLQVLIRHLAAVAVAEKMVPAELAVLAALVLLGV